MKDVEILYKWLSEPGVQFCHHRSDGSCSMKYIDGENWFEAATFDEAIAWMSRELHAEAGCVAESPKGDQHVVEPSEEQASDETEENPSQPDVRNQASGLTSPCPEQQAADMPIESAKDAWTLEKERALTEKQPMPKASPATSPYDGMSQEEKDRAHEIQVRQMMRDGV